MGELAGAVSGGAVVRRGLVAVFMVVVRVSYCSSVAKISMWWSP
jgi:hypothetical protein